MPHELILLKNMSQPGYTGSLADYERAGGYQAIRKVLGKMPPGDVTDLVKRSFEFMLAREGNTSILREFDLSTIERYFPEYAREFRPG